VGTLGFSLVLPFLVFLVTRWGGNALIYGIIGATYSVFQLLGAPILGRWSDRVGRRKVLLVSQLGTLLSWLVFLVAFALPETPLVRVDSGILGAFVLTAPLLVVFLARAMDGLTGGNVSVANAYLADISSEEDRSANYGKMAVAANLGFILGPAMAGLLGGTSLGELLPVLAATLVSVGASILILLRLPESRPGPMPNDYRPRSIRRMFGQESRDCVEATGPSRPGMGTLLRLPGVGIMLLVHFLVMLGFNVFYVAFPMHAVIGLDWSVVRMGFFFSVLSLLLALVQGPVLSRLSRRFADRNLGLAGGGILALSFPCFGTTSTEWMFLGATLLALGNGLLWPSVLSLLSKRAGSTYQGAVQGFAGSSGAAASILGLVVGGFLYTRLEGEVFLLAGGVVALAVLVLAGPGFRGNPGPAPSES
jgi:DHA1 family tetracycline resistance protein-like MFS transporter